MIMPAESNRTLHYRAWLKALYYDEYLAQYSTVGNAIISRDQYNKLASEWQEELVHDMTPLLVELEHI